MIMDFMSKSTTGINEWLILAELERYDSVITVTPGESKEFYYSGGQNFGSGGFWLSSRFAGEEPRFLAETGGDHNDFTSKYAAKFRFSAPSVVLVSSGSMQGSTSHTLYVCATEEQIAQAKRIVTLMRTAESASESTAPLKQFLKKNWLEYDQWLREYTGWEEAPQSKYAPASIQVALETGPLTSEELSARSYLKSDPSVLLSFNHVMYHMDSEDRLKVFTEAEAEYAAEIKAAQKNFAKNQAQTLKNMGLTTQQTWGLIRATGAGNSVACLKWLQENIGVQHTDIGTQKLAKAAKKTAQAYAAQYIVDVFHGYSLTPPPGGYQMMIKCLKGAQALGYIPESTTIRAN